MLNKGEIKLNRLSRDSRHLPSNNKAKVLSTQRFLSFRLPTSPGAGEDFLINFRSISTIFLGCLFTQNRLSILNMSRAEEGTLNSIFA